MSFCERRPTNFQPSIGKPAIRLFHATIDSQPPERVPANLSESLKRSARSGLRNATPHFIPRASNLTLVAFMSQHPARTYRAALRFAMTNYGMVFVLLFLMLVFSLLTVKEQRATGSDAGRQLADQIVTQYGSRAHVFIAVPASADDNAFAAAMEESITAAGGTVLGSVVGSPADARQKLEQLFAAEAKVDVVAVTGASAEWKVWARFTQLTPHQFAVPRPGRWPSFLTRSNLIGVANQTAIYAVIAIGMTMVIIGGGIDLSVGSLVALSSVTATMILRDYAGGVSATPFSVMFACLAGILLTAAAGFFNGLMVTQASLPPFLVTHLRMSLCSVLSSGECSTPSEVMQRRLDWREYTFAKTCCSFTRSVEHWRGWAASF